MAHAAVALSLAAALIAPAPSATAPRKPRRIVAAAAAPSMPKRPAPISTKLDPKKAKAAGPAKKSADAEPAFLAFPYPVEQHVLKNGLRVAFVDFDSPGLVAYYTLMRVGSRNEPEKGRSGYAHFFEHMMFRGTKTHSGEDYDATVARLGLSGNASTNNDATIYHVYGPARSLPTIIQYEADRFANLDYSEAGFKTEAGAIPGEYAKSASSPEQLLDEKLHGLAFAKHTYKHTTIGFLDDVKAMPEGYAYSREFFKRYYTPDNATLVLVGDFDKPRALALIQAAYSGWKGKARPAPIPLEPPQTKAKRTHLDWPTPTLARLWIAWHAPAASDLKSAAAETLLDDYLFGPTSALYQNLVLGQQLCDSIDGNWGYTRDPYFFGMVTEVKKDDDLPVVEKAVLDSIRELASGKVDRARLEAVRSHLKFATALRLDTADRAASWLSRMGSMTGDLQYPNRLYAQVDKVSAADLSAFAKRWLTANNSTTVTLTGAQKGVAK